MRVRPFVSCLVWAAMAMLAVANDQTVFRSDAARDGLTTEGLNGSTLTQVWDWTPGGGITSSPLIAGGRCYFATDAGVVYCYDLSSGNPVWQVAVSGPVDSTPCLDGGRLYVNASGGTLYALNASDGTVLWTVPHGYVEYSSPVVSGGLLYVSGGSNNEMRAYRTTDGTLAWRYAFPQPSWSSPAVYNGAVYCGANDGFLYCLNAGTGALIWSYYTSNSALATTPACANGQVVYPVGSASQSVVVLDAGTGTLLRTLAPADNGTSQAWADPGNLPVTGGWTYAGSPAIDGNEVYLSQELMGVAALGGASMLQFRVFALDLTTGATLWRNRWNVTAASSTLAGSATASHVPGGAAFAWAGLGNRLACFNAATGTLAGGTGMATLTGNAFSSPTCANGLVAVGTDAGHLYVFQTANTPPTAPTGFSPTFSGGNNYDGQGQNCHITWSASTDADGDPASSFTYLFQARYNNSNLDAAQDVSATTAAGVASFDLNSVPWTTHVYYRVRAQDALGAQSAWSATQDFYVDRWHFGPPAVTSLAALWGNRFVYLSWRASLDLDVVSYRLRYEPSGGNWSSPTVVDMGNVTTYTVTGLTNGVSYDFRVTPVDTDGTEGALAQVSSTPGIAATVGGIPYPTIQQAVDHALPGQTVMLDAGTYNGAVVLPAGVSLQGQGPGLSVVNGQGAPQVILLNGSSSQPTNITMLRITGGVVGIEVGGAPGDDPTLYLAHLIFSRLTGDAIHGTSRANLTGDFLTIANNGGSGINVSLASARVYDTILCKNGGYGVVNRGAASSVTIDHPCLSQNTQGRTSGSMTLTGWHVGTPRFTNEAAEDYTSLFDCPTLDRGRAAAPFDQEPSPNGGRANQGAFGDTQWATATSGYALQEGIAFGGGAGSGGWVELKSNAAGGFNQIGWCQLPWAAYDASDGGIHVALGHLSGAAGSEIVMGTNSGGWLAVMHHVGGTTTLLRWVQVPWSAYDAAVGATWPCCGDVDGDGTDELIVGLGPYPTNGGWAVVLNGLDQDFSVRTWLRLPQGAYDGASGETRVAAGDVDGDGRADIVVATGRAPGAGGFAQVFGDSANGYAPLAVVSWPDASFVASSGELWPAVGDLDGDGRSEVVLGPGAGGGGAVNIFGDAAAGYALRRQLVFPWAAYNAAQGEVRVACGNTINAPGAEVLGATGRYPSGGKAYLWNSALAGFAGVAWIPFDWTAYDSANGELFPAFGHLR